MRDDEPRNFEFGSSHPVGREPARRTHRRLWVWITVAAVATGAVYLYMFQPELIRPWLQGTPLEPPTSVTQAYKWQDADGQWQITGTPPPTGTPYERLEYRGDTNVMPLVPRDRD